MWVKIIDEIHGSYDGGSEFFPHIRQGVWSQIVGSINSLHDKCIIHNSVLKQKVHDGMSTKFWSDVWLCDLPLKQKFNPLYRLESDKNCTVHDRWNNGWCWTWSRQINGGLQNHLNELLAMLDSFRFHDAPDAWIWTLGGSKSFLVKDTRLLIDDSTLPEVNIETRWCRFIPKKVNILNLPGFA